MGIHGKFPDQFNSSDEPHIGPVWERTATPNVRAVISVKQEITFSDFSKVSPFSSLSVHYVEKSDHGAPCQIYFNGDNERSGQFHEAVRKCYAAIQDAGCGNFVNLTSGKGEGANVGIEGVRPEYAEKAMQVVVDTLQSEGLLIDTLKEECGSGFNDPVATASAVQDVADFFTTEINDIRRARDVQLAAFNASAEVTSGESKPATLVRGAPAVGA